MPLASSVVVPLSRVEAHCEKETRAPARKSTALPRHKGSPGEGPRGHRMPAQGRLSGIQDSVGGVILMVLEKPFLQLLTVEVRGRWLLASGIHTAIK